MDPGYDLEEMETNMESMFDHVNSKADNNMTSLLPSPSISSEMKERKIPKIANWSMPCIEAEKTSLVQEKSQVI